jgi:hypothetical protein
MEGLTTVVPAIRLLHLSIRPSVSRKDLTMLPSSSRLPMFSRALLAVFTALVILASSVHQSHGGDIAQTAVNRARNFLETERRGKFISSYLHFGSSYDGHEIKKLVGVTGPGGNVVEGHFALIYEFDWDKTGWTTVAFFFDEMGTFYELKALKSNAVINQPFLKADLAIVVLGSALFEIFKDQMNEDQKRDARHFIDNANSKGLLELSLQLQQRFGT